MKGSYIFLANGFEETEALATLDVLRRAGLDVKSVSITEDNAVTGAHNITALADLTFSEFVSSIPEGKAGKNDVMVFPGGMPGTTNLASCKPLMDLMIAHYNEGGSVAAICAAPGYVVAQLPGLKGKKFTCYDGCGDRTLAQGAEYVKAPSVTDGNLITGRGPGVAIDFALAIVTHVKGAELAAKIKAAMML